MVSEHLAPGAESSTVKHVGAIVSDRAHHVPESARVVSKGMQRVEEVARAWMRGKTRQHQRDLKRSVRVCVLKAVVKGVLFTSTRTRAWQTNHVHRMQTVVNVAICRVFNLCTSVMRRHGLSNLVLRKMVRAF